MDTVVSRVKSDTHHTEQRTPKLRVLVMTAVTAEKEAVMRGLGGAINFNVVEAGVGPALAAARTAKELSNSTYDLVISTGIGGGFEDKTEVGSIVVANEIIAADLGVQTSEGYQSVDELGFGSAKVSVDQQLVTRIARKINEIGLSVNIGPILTVSTVTGTKETASELSARIPGAMVEAMEGYGVAIAAKECGIPILEVRAISNLVGPRDRESWRIKEALETLEAASSIFLEVLL